MCGIGIITYSLRQGIAKPDLPAVIAKLGLNSVELMSGDAEAIAGAPAASDRPALTAWRAAVTPATWQGVRKQFNDQHVDLQILCYNMGVNITDPDIDYAFRMAQALGVSAISSSSTVAVAKRVAPFAAKYKMMWGGHGHNNITDPEQFGTEDSFEKIMEFGDYIGANLDVGHYNQTGADAVAAFIQKAISRCAHHECTHQRQHQTHRTANTVFEYADALGPGQRADQAGAPADAQGAISFSRQYRVRIRDPAGFRCRDRNREVCRLRPRLPRNVDGHATIVASRPQESQPKPPAPPLRVLSFKRWGRRFRLPIFSRVSRVRPFHT